jgi:hypothetical protein
MQPPNTLPATCAVAEGGEDEGVWGGGGEVVNRVMQQQEGPA